MAVELNIQYNRYQPYNLVKTEAPKKTLIEKENSSKIEKTTVDPLKSALKTVCATYNHEINNALAPIIMMAQMYAEKVDDPGLRDALELINDSAKRIRGVTKELYSQAYSNKELDTKEYVNTEGSNDSFIINLQGIA